MLFPAAHPASLAVTAVDARLRAYRYASMGSQISVAAWGVALSAAVPGGRRSVSGTSFATAVVAGALLRTPECSTVRNPAAMKARMMAQAKDLGAPGPDPVFGAGLFKLAAQKSDPSLNQTACPCDYGVTLCRRSFPTGKPAGISCPQRR